MNIKTNVDNYNLKLKEVKNKYIEFEDEYIEGPQKGNKFMNRIDAEAMSPYQLLFTRHQLAMQSTWRID